MSWMHGLRMFTDLSFYGVFAGAVFFLLQRIGGNGDRSFTKKRLGVWILSLIYGSSFRYREKKGKSRFLLLLFLGSFFCGRGRLLGRACDFASWDVLCG